MDAVRVAAGAALLLTALAAPGCGRAKREPAVPPAPPTAVARVGTLRIGLPKRGNLLFNCDGQPAPPRIGSALYAADSLDPSGRRWRRSPSAATDSASLLAPDTLTVRAFSDPTDEEIALERGELDVAVFWPGELSAHMRSDERFRDPELGPRASGVLACLRSSGDTAGVSRADMEVLNREAFGGDLLPLSQSAPDTANAPSAVYIVDPAVPGRKHLERILTRIPRAGGTRTLKLVYLDQPVAGLDGMASSWGTGVAPLFAVRCPVLASPAVRAEVRAIGAHTFAELAPCASGTRP